jgi:preprotein translocase subunit SecA
VAEAIPLGDQRRDTARLTYKSGSTAGSASYAVGGGGTASVSTDASGRTVEQREDGTTVRRVSGGDTYRAEEKIGRNDPCHCGSGKKYKRCHGA